MRSASEIGLQRLGGSRALQLGLCLALGAAASLALGQDASFDLRNYHLYNAYAFLNWRYGKDFLPAAMQTYFHPFADVPYYALALGALAGSPRALAACQGLYFGGLLYVSWRFNETFLEQRLAVLATLIGATAVGTVSEIGTTFNDIQVAALVVAAVVVLLNASGRTSRALAAGLLFGGAVVVKLYAVFYAVAAFGAMLVVHGRSAARRVLWALAGATVAVCTLYGWWAWWVWSQTGNPVFPYFNAFFESPLFSRENYSANFAGWEPYHFLIAPLRWATVQRDAVAELRFRDPRLLAGFAAAVIVALALAGGEGGSADRRRKAFLLAFAAMAYVLWLWQFRLLRFAIPLEVMSGTLIMVAIERIDRIGRSAGASPRRAVVAGGAVLVLLAAWTIPMSWGRVPFGRSVFAAASVHLPLPPDSLVLVAEQPTAYVLPLLDAPGLEAVGVSYLSALSPHVEAEVAARVRAHAGPMFAVRRMAATPFRVPGAALALADCAPLTTGLETLELCRVIAVPSRE